MAEVPCGYGRTLWLKDIPESEPCPAEPEYLLIVTDDDTGEDTDTRIPLCRLHLWMLDDQGVPMRTEASP